MQSVFPLKLFTTSVLLQVLFQIGNLLRAKCSTSFVPQSTVRFQCRSSYWASNVDLGKTNKYLCYRCYLKPWQYVCFSLDSVFTWHCLSNFRKLTLPHFIVIFKILRLLGNCHTLSCHKTNFGGHWRGQKQFLTFLRFQKGSLNLIWPYASTQYGPFSVYFAVVHTILYT